MLFSSFNKFRGELFTLTFKQTIIFYLISNSKAIFLF